MVQQKGYEWVDLWEFCRYLASQHNRTASSPSGMAAVMLGELLGCQQGNGIYVIHCISFVPIRQTIEHPFFFGHSPFLVVMILTLMLSLRTKAFVGDLARIPGDDWCIEITDSELPVTPRHSMNFIGTKPESSTDLGGCLMYPAKWQWYTFGVELQKILWDVWGVHG